MVVMNVIDLKKLKIGFYKSGDKNRVSAVNAVLSEIELIESRQNKTLSELEIDAVIKKTVSMFDEMTDLAEKANRDTSETILKADYLQSLLPKQLTEEEIIEEVRKAIVESGAMNIGEMGKAMAWLKKEHGSSLDMKIASEKVREALLRE